MWEMTTNMHPGHTLGLVRRHAWTPLMKQACVNEAPGYAVAQCSSSSLHIAVAASVTAPKNDGPASRVRGQGSARPLAWRNVAVHEPDFCWRTTIRLSKPTVPPLAAFLNSSTHEQKINCISRESNTGLAETVRS
jgi:hypothetical protein